MICYIEDARLAAHAVSRISGSTVTYFDSNTIDDWRWLMSKLQINDNVETGMHSGLERAFIREYLLDKGFYLEDLETMSKAEAKNLMAGASRFASLKLAEMESRSQFRRKLAEANQSWDRFVVIKTTKCE